jgi:hypothetical protein
LPDMFVDRYRHLGHRKASLVLSFAPTEKGNTPVVRCLHAPIRGLLTVDEVKPLWRPKKKINSQEPSDISMVSVVSVSSQRLFQDGAAQSEFGLDVGITNMTRTRNSPVAIPPPNPRCGHCHHLPPTQLPHPLHY